MPSLRQRGTTVQAQLATLGADQLDARGVGWHSPAASKVFSPISMMPPHSLRLDDRQRALRFEVDEVQVESDSINRHQALNSCSPATIRPQLCLLRTGTCPQKLDRFEVGDFASCGPGALPCGREFSRGNLPQRAMGPDLIVVALPLQ